MKTFEEDFKRERADREGMCSKMTALNGQILTLQQTLHDERHEKGALIEKLEMESLLREELEEELEEVKYILTQKCDDKCKSLEDQNTELETEVTNFITID